MLQQIKQNTAYQEKKESNEERKQDEKQERKKERKCLHQACFIVALGTSFNVKLHKSKHTSWQNNYIFSGLGVSKTQSIHEFKMHSMQESAPS